MWLVAVPTGAFTSPVGGCLLVLAGWLILRWTTRSVRIDSQTWSFRGAFRTTTLDRSAIRGARHDFAWYAMDTDHGPFQVAGYGWYPPPGYPDGFGGSAVFPGIPATAVDAPTDPPGRRLRFAPVIDSLGLAFGALVLVLAGVTHAA